MLFVLGILVLVDFGIRGGFSRMLRDDCVLIWYVVLFLVGSIFFLK